ncbi:hypothetical protein [Klebsiella phage GZ7]|nr:hypothetical protein [Klebsiella phage GZ7]
MRTSRLLTVPESTTSSSSTVNVLCGPTDVRMSVHSHLMFISTSVTDTGMGNAAVFNRGEHLDSLIPGKAGIGHQGLNNLDTYGLAVLNVGFAARLLIGFTFLLSQAGMFALLCLAADAIGFFLCFAALCFNSGLLFTLRTLSCFSLLTFGSLFGQNRFALSGGCGVNFTLRLFCRFTLRFLFCQALNLFFAGNALAFGFCFLLSLLTVESVIHQQSHFVVRLNPSSQLPIELFIHGQCFGMQCVHGFFGLNALLLGFPFGQRLTCRIAQLVTCVNEPLNFRLSRAHSLFKALQVLAPRLFDCRLAA